MKAAIRRRYGSPSVVELVEIDRPTPAATEVLVRVEAASVNRADLDYLEPRPSFLRLMLGLRRPRDPRIGFDVAGVVEEVGPEVTRLRPGDRVLADLFPYGGGAFAEYACAGERAFQAVPDDLSFEDAATLPHAATLAIQSLRWRREREVGPGDRVLIDGASGNVGPFAVQIAKARGAEVTAVCHGSKAAFVRSLGADHVIDYTRDDITRMRDRWDWIVAPDAHHPVLAMRRALRPGGVYVTLGGGSLDIADALLLGRLTGRATGRRMGLLLWWAPLDPDDLASLFDLIASGRVRPAIDRRYPLDEIRPALEHVHQGRARGKVVITMGQGRAAREG